jgi:hypothetical protein
MEPLGGQPFQSIRQGEPLWPLRGLREANPAFSRGLLNTLKGLAYLGVALMILPLPVCDWYSAGYRDSSVWFGRVG